MLNQRLDKLRHQDTVHSLQDRAVRYGEVKNSKFRRYTVQYNTELLVKYIKIQDSTAK